jgi:thiol reductant ABC exporter CydC subunit
MTRAAWLAAASLTAGSGAMLAGVGLIATAGYLIARAAERPPILDLMLIIVTVRAFGLTRPVLRYAERLASHDLMFRMLKTVRGWFVGALLPLSRGQLTAYRTGDLLSRMAADVEALQESYLRVIAPGVVAVVVSAITTTGFALVDIRLAAVVFSLLVAYGAGWSWLAYRQSHTMAARRNQLRRALSADLVAMIQASDDILTCGFESRAQERLAAAQRQLDTVDARDGRMLGVHAAAATAFTLAAMWGVLVLAHAAAAKGQLAPILMAPLVLAAIASFESVEGLPAAWQSAAQTRDSGRRVLEIVRTPPAVTEAPHPEPLGDAAPTLSLEHVTFGYDRHAPILDDVTLQIDGGQHVAIVGPTGVGKSTLLALLLRDWDPDDGVIRINGIDLRLVDLDGLRARTAVLPQQVHVFNDTLRNNVRIARRGATDDEVKQALTQAGLGAFVLRAADGLETRLGEHGARMSAGERQRLGLARVLLTKATLVLADEPTANLDATCEHDVLRALHQWAVGRTLVVVSHRPAARAFADRVVTL